MIRFILCIVLLLLAAFVAATLFWVSCLIEKQKHIDGLVDDAVDGAIEQFEKERASHDD